MTWNERQEVATVRYDVCSGCGATERVEAVIDGEEFDPRSRSWGFTAVYLWEGHPWDGKHLCGRCSENRVHVVEPVGIEGMVRVRAVEVEQCDACGGGGCALHLALKNGCQGGSVYGERGLQLSAAPPTDEEVATWYLALVVRRGLAVPLVRYWDHWAPPKNTLGSHFLHNLCGGDRSVLVCEHTRATPWPTVLEPRWLGHAWDNGDWKGDPEPLDGWPDALVARAQHGIFEVVAIRVPMEIMQ